MAVTVERSFCADVSSEHAEDLRATASRVDHWLLVEYRGLWNRAVLGQSLLSERVKAHLRAVLAELPHARILFVKQPERRARERRMLYFGSSVPGAERLYGLEFEEYEDLLALELAATLTGEVAGVPLDHPVFVVCTHGKRDRCCAKYGRPLYERLRREVDPDWVWQSTHVGGDRFAGNVVCLPHGLFYGRVDGDDVALLAAEYVAGRVDLAHYRGRSVHPFPVQAAEAAVREETGLLGIADVSHVGGVQVAPGAWRIQMRAEPLEREFDVDVLEERGEEPLYLTCGAAAPLHPRRWRATGLAAR